MIQTHQQLQQHDISQLSRLSKTVKQDMHVNNLSITTFFHWRVYQWELTKVKFFFKVVQKKSKRERNFLNIYLKLNQFCHCINWNLTQGR